jgi:hypothetical protein
VSTLLRTLPHVASLDGGLGLVIDSVPERLETIALRDAAGFATSRLGVARGLGAISAQVIKWLESHRFVSSIEGEYRKHVRGSSPR